MAERRRFPLLPVALGGCLVLLFVILSGGSGAGSAPPSGRLLQSLAAEAQVRPQRQVARTSLVAGKTFAAPAACLLDHPVTLAVSSEVLQYDRAFGVRVFVPNIHAHLPLCRACLHDLIAPR